MYVTRPLSQLLKSPDLLAAPPDGPNSGYLVIQDEEPVTYSRFGWCKNRGDLTNLPFPQNKGLIVRYMEGGSSDSFQCVFFIPVLNQPLSSNQYYTIVPYGQHKGEAFTCSREEDKVICCFSRLVEDVKPRPLDPQNIYQQFKIINFRRNGYFATSIAADGFPPYFLGRRNGWWYTNKTPPHFKLDIAQGLNSKLRARLPDFDFPLSRKTSEPFVVGKCNTNDTRVTIDASVEKEEVFVYGSKAMWNEEKVVDGVIWFTSCGLKGEQMRVGLRVEVVERMKWEQEIGGWIGGEKRRAKINRVEELKEGGEWSKFGCYVLVERFNLKRMDGSLVMSYDFRHFHQMKTKWE
ncbi:hypothetical protein DH2020_032503 [Rehmannia glutinosa]|uniref:F-box protein n=1 Tax=Rehmannia glutinosa TaxID=99300 RepID=A0ABR0VFU1_REHGL